MLLAMPGVLVSCAIVGPRGGAPVPPTVSNAERVDELLTTSDGPARYAEALRRGGPQLLDALENAALQIASEARRFMYDRYWIGHGEELDRDPPHPYERTTRHGLRAYAVAPARTIDEGDRLSGDQGVGRDQRLSVEQRIANEVKAGTISEIFPTSGTYVSEVRDRGTVARQVADRVEPSPAQMTVANIPVVRTVQAYSHSPDRIVVSQVSGRIGVDSPNFDAGLSPNSLDVGRGSRGLQCDTGWCQFVRSVRKGVNWIIYSGVR